MQAGVVLGPDSTQRLLQAAEVGWEVLVKSGSVFAQPYKAAETRDAMARKLLELAQSGAHGDPQHLASRVLKELNLYPVEGAWSR